MAFSYGSRSEPHSFVDFAGALCSPRIARTALRARWSWRAIRRTETPPGGAGTPPLHVRPSPPASCGPCRADHAEVAAHFAEVTDADERAAGARWDREVEVNQ